MVVMSSDSQVQILSPFLISPVTLKKLLTSQFPHLEDGDNNSLTLEGYYKN
jgi:hypothetical protein